MKRDLQRLADERFDLCIIGGGINGLATAWDASLRGLNVALIERGDFGGETSANSLKILHGGLRYLQHLDFSRMRESILERRAFLTLAPSLVEPLGFLVPTYPGLMKGRAAMRAAFAVNDLVRGSSRDERRIPNGKILSAQKVQELVPELPGDDVTGGALFYDLRMKCDSRVTLGFALSAAEQGAALANQCEARRFVQSGDRIESLEVVDRETGASFEICADQFAAMTGPWRSLLPNLVKEGSLPQRVVKSAGIQIITTRQVCPESGLAVPSRHVDEDAHLQRGGRHYFSTPWRGHTIWGTTDATWEGDPDTWRVRESDVVQFLEELNESLPGLNLRRDEVVYAFGGLRMMSEGNQGTGAQVARRYEVYDHQRDLGIQNLISMDGVKYTACRMMAEKAVDLIAGKVERTLNSCTTRNIGIVPLQDDDEAEFAAAAGGQWNEKVRETVLIHYGSRWREVFALARDRLDFDCVANSDTPRAALLYGIEHECALHLDDLLMRRTALGTLGDPGAAVVEECLSILSASLSLSSEQEDAERERVRDHYALAD